MTILILVASCAIFSLAALTARSYAIASRSALIGSAATFVLSVMAVFFPDILGKAEGLSLSGWCAWMLLLVGFVQLAATAVSVRYLAFETQAKIVTENQARWYFALLPLFVMSMALALASDSLGLTWIAIEGTTLATTMLVAFYTKDGSLEAAWKYILVCSAGIAIGLVGILLLTYSAASGAGAEAAVTWSSLMSSASALPPQIVKLAFVFLFIGFGAKVGIVPMHTWLPDAHSRTPSPVSGMLSGVLLPVALAAIIKGRAVVDAVLGSSDWTNGFFLAFGTLSVVVSAAFMVRQGHYKRLLAYSSIEHMGLACFCLGLGPVGIPLALVHLSGHALVKSALFFGAGDILNAYGSSRFSKVSGVARALPGTATLFVLLLLMLLAVPPSPLFFSEFGIAIAGMAKAPYLTVLVLASIVIAAVSFFMHFFPMLFLGRADAMPRELAGDRRPTVVIMSLCALLVAAGGIALFIGFGWPALNGFLRAI